MSGNIETSMEGFGFIPEDSILHLIAGSVEKFGRMGRFKRWFSKRYEKIALPFLFAGLMIVLWSQGQFREPIPILGIPAGVIINLFFLIVSMVVLVFIFGSFFFLKMKAGGAQGALKFNVINEYTGSRENEVEHDVLIKRHNVINPNLARFEIFEKILDKYGRPKQMVNTETLKDEDYNFDDITSDPTISEIIAEIDPEKSSSSVSPSVTPPIVQPHKYAKTAFEEEDLESSSVSNNITDLTVANQSQLIMAHESQKKQDPIVGRPVFTEITPISSFFRDKDLFLVHVIDFTSQYEFRKSKQPGMLMLYPDENLDNIFPQPTDVFATVGMTFGTIPMYCVDVIPIAYKGKVPLYYPVTTKKRNLSLANLGHYHEILPTKDAILSALNLVELEVARPLQLVLNYIGKQTDSHMDNMDQLIRRGMGFADRQLNSHKIMHKPESPKNSYEYILLGFGIALLTVFWWYPIWKFVAGVIGIDLP